jgi:chaperonin GroES
MAEPMMTDPAMMQGIVAPFEMAAPMEPAKPAFGEKKSRLLSYAEMDNIAEVLTEDQLKEIGQRVVDEYKDDEKSREEWMKRNEEALKLANQVREEKTFPWPGAANVKLPLIADAAIKFASRAYPEIIKDGNVVKGKVIGPDPQGQKAERAGRIGKFMSWQLTEQMPEWDEDTDKLLHILAVSGNVFRKFYYNPSLKRNCSQLIMADKLCVNYTASSIESARRITHILDNTPKNTVVSNQRSGIWLDVKLSQDDVENEPDTDPMFNLIEQHRWLDLDDDGYQEPYIVTVHKDTSKVLRIYARFEEKDIKESPKGEIASIEPCQYFSAYRFIPSFDHGFYWVGFGSLMSPLNEVANGLFNQLMDAGAVNNLQSGFLSKEIKVRGGNYRFTTGEWKKTEATAEQLTRGVVALPTKEPSATLFNLLGLVMELTRDLAAIQDVLAGDSPGANTSPTTVMALIEQGMKVYNAIYKRIYRALKQEFTILFKLNYRYLDEEEYFRVQEQDSVAFRQDFESKEVDVIPVADPYMSSDVQRLTRFEALRSFIGMPGVDPRPILIFGLESMRIDDEMIDQILPEKDPNTNPEALAMMHEAELAMSAAQQKEAELNLRERELDLKEREAVYTAVLKQAQAQKALAEAAATKDQTQLAALSALTEAAYREIDRDDARAAELTTTQEG